MDHLHEKEGKVQVQLNPKCHDGHLHAEEGEDQVQFNPERQGSHLQAEVVEGQIPLKTKGCHLKAEEGEYKVQLIQSRPHGDHLHEEEGVDQVQLNPERQGDHMHALQKRVNIKSNSMQEAVVVTCMKREGQGVEARAPLSLFLAVMVWFLQS